uniref:UvrABC system protein C n=1 Tax=wastewater metagenome TaxID=527639 RepID=A0A0A8KWX6_9ZZZZ
MELSERLKNIPHLPGVYIMKDGDGVVLYVGKAKDLKNRVKSYFSGADTRYRIPYLVKQLKHVDTIVTEDERQALLLESDLIKKHKPHYNVRLKDDKSYLVVRVDLEQEWPRLEVGRQVAEDGAKYFGPYAFGYEVRTMLEVIKQTLPLRTCSDRVMHNRVRPCLEYQIKRCAAPCCLSVDRAQYMEWISEAMLILDGKSDEVIRLLEKKMLRASEERRFEDAAKCRDSIVVLRKISEQRSTYSMSPGACDVVGLYREGSQAEISLLSVRRGRIYDSRTYGFSELAVDDEELLGSFLSQYYQEQVLIPDEILLPFALEDEDVRAEILSLKRGKTTKVFVPQRGDKSRIVHLAEENARANFRARFADGGKDGVLESLKNAFMLEDMPRCIECVDISHFQGGETVASVVFFKDGKPDKTRYRCFHLSVQGKPDDFASMREVIGRHLSRCAEENTLSDLMIIDGGPQQLAQGVFIRKQLGVQRPEMVGLAKKRTIASPYLGKELFRLMVRKKPERVFIENREEPIILKPNSAELNLIERIRNEAHRFAITFHRKTRSRRIFSSALDNIPGLGPKRRALLLREFGSIKALKESSATEIATRCSFPEHLANLIVAKLHQ